MSVHVLKTWCHFATLTITWHDNSTTVYTDKDVLTPHGDGDFCILTGVNQVDHIPFSYVKKVAVDTRGCTEEPSSIYADWSK